LKLKFEPSEDSNGFDAYPGTTALIEGNVFKAVDQLTTASAHGVSTVYTVANGGEACTSVLGRACAANSVDSASGELSGGESSSVISTMAKISKYLVTPIDANEVAALVIANAGPANVGASSDASGSATGKITESAAIPASNTAKTPVTTAVSTRAAVVTSAIASPVLVSETECDDWVEASTSAIASPVLVSDPECDNGGEVSTTVPAAAQATGEASVAKLYERCGGEGFTGPTACESGTICKEWNPWYSQCIATSARARRKIMGDLQRQEQRQRVPFAFSYA
jgi:hypothetical protein